jgi:hypothetical protein
MKAKIFAPGAFSLWNELTTHATESESNAQAFAGEFQWHHILGGYR